jgi:hypothetical protein
MTARRRLPRPSERRTLGPGLEVSPICIGRVEDPETIAAAFDAGINFFFLSGDLHWQTYEHTRRGLAALLRRDPAVRAQLVVALVSYVAQPGFSDAAFIETLYYHPELGHIDLGVAGCAAGPDLDGRLQGYRTGTQHRVLGMHELRAGGATFHDRAAALAACRERAIDVAFVRYNPGHARARAEILERLPAPPRPLVYAFNCAWGHVAAGMMQEMGLDADNWQPSIGDHYRFALTRPELDGILCAPRTPADVAELVRALDDAPLDDDEETYMIRLAGMRRAVLAARAAAARDHA